MCLKRDWVRKIVFGDLHKIMFCGYPFVLPHRCDSNGYPQHMANRETLKMKTDYHEVPLYSNML